MELRNNLLDNNVLTYLVECCKQTFDESYFANYGTGSDALQPNGDKLTPKSQYVTYLKNLSWAVSNFCRYGGHSPKHLGHLLECLYYLLSVHGEVISWEDSRPHDSESFGGNIGWSFTYLTNDISDEENERNNGNEILRIMNDNGITKELIKLLGSKNVNTVHSVLRAVGNILTGSDADTTKCLELGVLPYLKHLMIHLNGKNDQKMKELCWAISNITAGPKQHIIQIINNGFIPIIIEILANSRSMVSNEALWAVSNATAGANKEIMNFLVGQGLIPGLCKYFENRYKQQHYSKSQDRLLLVALECIEGILVHDDSDHKFAIQFETYRGTDFLEYLQAVDNISELVCEKAVAIIRQYFGGDDDDNGQYGGIGNDVNIDCNIDGNQFGFGLNRNDQNNAENNTNNNTSNTFQF